MTRLLAVLAACIVLPLLSYGVFAFAAWSLFPGEWTEPARFACALLALFVTGVGIRALLDWMDRE